MEVSSSGHLAPTPASRAGGGSTSHLGEGGSSSGTADSRLRQVLAAHAESLGGAEAAMRTAMELAQEALRNGQEQEERLRERLRQLEDEKEKWKTEAAAEADRALFYQTKHIQLLGEVNRLRRTLGEPELLVSQCATLDIGFSLMDLSPSDRLLDPVVTHASPGEVKRGGEEGEVEQSRMSAGFAKQIQRIRSDTAQMSLHSLSLDDSSDEEEDRQSHDGDGGLVGGAGEANGMHGTSVVSFDLSSVSSFRQEHAGDEFSIPLGDENLIHIDMVKATAVREQATDSYRPRLHLLKSFQHISHHRLRPRPASGSLVGQRLSEEKKRLTMEENTLLAELQEAEVGRDPEEPEEKRRHAAATTIGRFFKHVSVREKFIRLVHDYAESPHSRNQRLRNKVTREFINSEASYVYFLEMAVTHFLIPLLGQSKSSVASRKIPTLKLGVIRNLFGNSEVIFSLAASFLLDLRAKFEDWPSSAIGIADLLSDMLVQLGPAYEAYVINYPKACKVLEKLGSKKPFRQWMDAKSQEVPLFAKHQLNSFLVMPIQRMPRYILLLQELLRFTPSDHVEYSALVSCLDRVSSLVTNLNEERRRADCLAVVSDLERKLTGESPGLCLPSRVLLRQDEVVLVLPPKAGGSGDGGRKRTLVLFNDLLLWASVAGSSGMMKYQGSVPLAGATLEFLQDTDERRNAFNVRVPSADSAVRDIGDGGSVFSVQCDSSDSKDAWMRDISRAIAVLVTLEDVSYPHMRRRRAADGQWKATGKAPPSPASPASLSPFIGRARVKSPRLIETKAEEDEADLEVLYLSGEASGCVSEGSTAASGGVVTVLEEKALPHDDTLPSEAERDMDDEKEEGEEEETKETEEETDEAREADRLEQSSGTDDVAEEAACPQDNLSGDVGAMKEEKAHEEEHGEREGEAQVPARHDGDRNIAAVSGGRETTEREPEAEAMADDQKEVADVREAKGQEENVNSGGGEKEESIQSQEEVSAEAGTEVFSAEVKQDARRDDMPVQDDDGEESAEHEECHSVEATDVGAPAACNESEQDLNFTQEATGGEVAEEMASDEVEAPRKDSDAFVTDSRAVRFDDVIQVESESMENLLLAAATSGMTAAEECVYIAELMAMMENSDSSGVPTRREEGSGSADSRSTVFASPLRFDGQADREEVDLRDTGKEKAEKEEEEESVIRMGRKSVRVNSKESVRILREQQRASVILPATSGAQPFRGRISMIGTRGSQAAQELPLSPG